MLIDIETYKSGIKMYIDGKFVSFNDYKRLIRKKKLEKIYGIGYN